MKKIANKFSKIFIALTFIFLNVISVGAYNQNIEINNNIIVPENISPNVKNKLSLTGDLKNNSAVVNLQYVKITQAQFEEINKKFDESNKYNEQVKPELETISTSIKTEQAHVEQLKKIAELEGATEEQIKEYNDAQTTYENNFKAHTARMNEINQLIIKKYNEAINLIPDFDNTKWTKLTLKESTATSNIYEFDGVENTQYYVVWVKVTLNGKDYYNYEVKCYKDEDEPKYYCEYKNGKYYNKAGKEVTKEEYEADCLEKKYCEISNGKYYDENGNEVTKQQYELSCGTKKYCEIVDGKYYNKTGNEVTKEEYEADCIVYEEPKLCKVEDGKYYDHEGFEVTKEDYEKACTTPENPKTGLGISITYGVLIVLIAISSYTVVRKAKKFSR